MKNWLKNTLKKVQEVLGPNLIVREGRDLTIRVEVRNSKDVAYFHLSRNFPFCMGLAKYTFPGDYKDGGTKYDVINGLHLEYFFGINGITDVYFEPYKITIFKTPAIGWEKIKESIVDSIYASYESEPRELGGEKED